MMTSDNNPFSIEVIRQGWLDGADPHADLCSHGTARIVIGGAEIAGAETDVGISESALSLMRTVFADRDSSTETERLILAGTGALLMMGSPEGVDWNVRHDGDVVMLSDVVRYPTLNEADAVRYGDLEVAVPLSVYAAQIGRFAEQAKHLFEGVDKVIPDSYDRADYEAFWSEYDSLLTRVLDAAGSTGSKG